MDLDIPYENEQKFIAFGTKGLEFVTEKEIKDKFLDALILNKLDKRIVFSIKTTAIKDLIKLKTADDVHLSLGSIADIKDEKAIVDHFPLGKIPQAKEIIKEIRKLQNTFSLTLSKYKNDGIKLDLLQKALSTLISTSFNMNYTPRDHTNFDIRVYIEKTDVFFSCRLSRTSLYNRAYKKTDKLGSLKATVAAAICMLTNPEKGKKLVDNFCGSGTILCEAALQGLEPYGGDIDEGAVECAIKNLKGISAPLVKNIKKLDATSTNWPKNYFDYAISNYPWGCTL